MTLAKLKKEVRTDGTVFDWAIGWLAREDKIDADARQASLSACASRGGISRAANAA